jgi:hypothetical protein
MIWSAFLREKLVKLVGFFFFFLLIFVVEYIYFSNFSSILFFIMNLLENHQLQFLHIDRGSVYISLKLKFQVFYAHAIIDYY